MLVKYQGPPPRRYSRKEIQEYWTRAGFLCLGLLLIGMVFSSRGSTSTPAQATMKSGSLRKVPDAVATTLPQEPQPLAAPVQPEQPPTSHDDLIFAPRKPKPGSGSGATTDGSGSDATTGGSTADSGSQGQPAAEVHGHPCGKGVKCMTLLVRLTFSQRQYKEQFLTAFAQYAPYVQENEPNTVAYEVLDEEPSVTNPGGLIVTLLERYVTRSDYEATHKHSDEFKDKFRPVLQAMQDAGTVEVEGRALWDSGLGFVR